ncbi:Cobalt transport protein [uncultured archaeon]|nr:Cobalt transport protein [uncultured archaeon]
MFAIDEMAYRSPLRAWPPLGKLLLALALLLGSLFSPTPLVPLIVLAIGLALLWLSCKLKLPDIMALACIETLLMLFISVLIITLIMPGETVWQMNVGGIPLLGPAAGALAGPGGLTLKITHEGLNLAILLMVRAMAGFVVLLFFASSTPLPHLFFAMRQIGLPSYLAELVVLVYRYSFMLLEQMQQMATAADCRLGFGGLRRSLRTTGTLIAGLFGRSMDFADRAQAALACRNFRGEFMPFRTPAGLTARWVAGPLLVLAVLVLIGQQFPHVLVI